MDHKHPVIDSDARFIIDPETREITTTSTKLELIQGDHQSERITFEIPKTVEGHDMSLCDRIEIHYINIDKKTKVTSKDIYVASDVVVDDDKLTFTWLISGNATKYYGKLNFIVLFECLDDDGNYTYKWNTEICKLLSVGEGISNTEAVSEDYSDILEKFREEVLEEAVSEVITEKTLPNINASYPDAKIALYRIGNWEFNKSGLYKLKLEPSSGTTGYLTQIFQKNTLEDGTTPEDFDTKNIVYMGTSSGDGQVEAFYAIVDYFDNEKFTTYKMQFINQPYPGKLFVNTYDKETKKWSKMISTNVTSAKKVDYPLTINKNGKTDTYNGSSEKTIDVPSKTSELVNDSLISFTESQELTDEQKTQARDNIGAISEAELVQPDWNQNDEAAKDYIKNRIAYYGDKSIGTPTRSEYTIEAGASLNGMYFKLIDDLDYFTLKEAGDNLVLSYKGVRVSPRSSAGSSDTYKWRYPVTNNEISVTFEIYRISKLYRASINNETDKSITIKAEDISFLIPTKVPLPADLLPCATTTTLGGFLLPSESTSASDWDNNLVIYSDGTTTDSFLNWWVASPINAGHAVSTLTTSLLAGESVLTLQEGNTIISKQGDDTISDLGLTADDYPVITTYIGVHSRNGEKPYFWYLLSTFSGKKATFTVYAGTKEIGNIIWHSISASSDQKFAGFPGYDFADNFAKDVIDYNMAQNGQYTPVAYTSAIAGLDCAFLTQSGLGVDTSGDTSSEPNSIRFAGIDNGIYREVTLTKNATEGEADVVKNEKEFRLIDEPYYDTRTSCITGKIDAEVSSRSEDLSTKDLEVFHDMCQGTQNVTLKVGNTSFELEPSGFFNGVYSLNYEGTEAITHNISGTAQYIGFSEDLLNIFHLSTGTDFELSIGELKQIDSKYIKDMYYSKDEEIIELGNTYDVWKSIASADPGNTLISYKMNGVLYQNASSKKSDSVYTYNGVSPYDHYLAVDTGNQTISGPDGADFTFVEIKEAVLNQIPSKYIPIDNTTIKLNDQGQLTLALSNANGVSF